MIKKLKLIKTGNSGTYYIENGEKVDGVHQKITGNPIGIYGNVTKIWGDVSKIWGDVYALSGNVSGLSGNADGIKGNINECEITDEERAKGIRIEDLVGEEKENL